MKKIISFFVVCMLLCVNVFASDNFHSVRNDTLKLDVFNCAEGLYSVADTTYNRYGFIDVYGNIVIPCEYKSVGKFNDGICPVVTVDNEVYLINHKNEKIYKHTEKHIQYVKRGDFGVVVDKSRNGERAHLVNSKYENTVNEQLGVIQNGFYSFFTGSNNSVYNYKGVDISAKVRENTEDYSAYFANDKVIGKIVSENDTNRLKIFDIDGNLKFNVESSTWDIRDVHIDNNFIVLSTNFGDFIVYNMNGKEIYRIENRITHQIFDKYITFKKDKGTSAVYDFDGNVIVDFGKWDEIYPTLNGDMFIVGVNKKYGVVDKAGEFVLPLEYITTGMFYSEMLLDNGKYICLRDSEYNYHTMNVLTKKLYNGEVIAIQGGKYLVDGNTIMDDNFNVITSAKPYKLGILDGVFVNSDSPLSLLVFSDLGGVKVKLNTEYLTFDQSPTIINGRTMVPLRKIFEEIGANVTWNGTDQSINAKKDNTTIKMQINNNIMTINQKQVTLDVTPQIIGGRTLVPVRAISEAFDIVVDWNNYCNTVSLYTK